MGKEWKCWKLSIREDVIIIVAAILKNEFWIGAHMFLQLFEPFVRLLGTLGIDRSIMGDAHDRRVQELEAVRSKGIDDMTIG